MVKRRVSFLMSMFILGGILLSLSCNFPRWMTLNSSKGEDPRSVPSLEAAIDIVLDEIIKPEQLDHQLIVFAWPDLLKPGDVIGPYNQPGSEIDQSPTMVEEESWFIWIDDAPAAMFSHPSRFVLITKESGEIRVSDQVWWPIFNGLGLWTIESEYWNEANWAFSNLEPVSIESNSVADKHLASAAGRVRLQTGTSKTAIVINTWKEDETQKEHFEITSKGMHDALKASDFEITFLGPAQDDNPDKDGVLNTETRLKFFEDKYQEMVPGDTLVVYVAGHGGGDDSEKGSVGSHVMESGLRANLKRFNPGVHIIVIIDACYSGDFVDGLNEVADITITSTNNDTAAYTAAIGNDYEQDIDDPNPDDKGLEFSSGFIKGWMEIINNKSKMDEARRRAESSGTGIWEEVAAMSYVKALELDVAYLNKKTFPLSVRGAAETRPTPVPATPTPTPEPTPTSSLGDLFGQAFSSAGDSAEACAVFDEIEIPSTILRHMRDCEPTDYWVSVNGTQGNCFLEDGFDDRLYCRVIISPDEASTLGYFELFANPCQEPISVLNLTIPELEGCGEPHTEPDEPDCDS